MNRPLFSSAFASTLLLLGAASAHAATIVIVNNDPAGQGFNDSTVVAPVGSNAGTTLGQQRLNVMQAAANQWGAVLASNVTIRVGATFESLTCAATSAVLGSAGAAGIFSSFPNAPVAGTWFSAAESDALANLDNNPAANDITARFNVNIDAGCLTGTVGWWYDTNGNNPIPANRIALMPVVFHELAHGLGFQTYTSTSSGNYASGLPSIWDSFLTDANLNGGTAWTAMTAAQRVASAIDDPNLVWSGANVNAKARGYLEPAPSAIVHAPAALAGAYEVQTASFGPLPPLSGVRGLVVAALDGTAPTIDGCEPFTNAAAVAGKIALVDRGLCNFTVKVANAQAAGAIAVLVANNAATGLPGMGGADPTITIPSYGITQALGNSIRSTLAVSTPVEATLGFNFASLAGMTNGMVRNHAPNPLVTGSSVSHFTTAASPNLLMEPAINDDLFSATDLTVPLFRDIHWPILDAAIVNVAPTIDSAPEFDAVNAAPSPLKEIVFGDADAGDAPIVVTFEVDAGTIALAAAAGVTRTGSGTDTASISGARATLLPYVIAGNVTFTNALDSLADVGLLLTVNDNGNSGSGGAKSDSTVATIHVVGDTPPTLVTPIADQVDSEGDTVNLNVAANFSDNETALTFSTASTLPPGLTLSTAGVISGTIGFTSAGTYPGIVIAANDGTSTVNSNAFSWLVVNTNRTPTATSQAISVAEDGSVLVTLAGTDPDGDTIGFTVTAPPTHGTINGTLPSLTYSPAANYSGPDSIKFTVNDGSASSAVGTISITVTPVNDAPTQASPIANKSNTEGDSVNASIAANFSDVDNATLTYTTSSTLPPGIVLSTAGVFSGSLADGSAGTYANIVVQASDGIASVSGTPFTWTVAQGVFNVAPVVEDQDFSVNVDAADGAVVGTIVTSDADVGDTRDVTVTGGTGATLFVVAPDGTITVATDATLVAGTTLTLNVTVEDAGGLTDTAVVSIEVLALDVFSDGFEDAN